MMSKNLSSAAVLIGALRVKRYTPYVKKTGFLFYSTIFLEYLFSH